MGCPKIPPVGPVHAGHLNEDRLLEPVHVRQDLQVLLELLLIMAPDAILQLRKRAVILDFHGIVHTLDEDVGVLQKPLLASKGLNCEAWRGYMASMPQNMCSELGSCGLWLRSHVSTRIWVIWSTSSMLAAQ